jgi:hypothetical protein
MREEIKVESNAIKQALRTMTKEKAEKLFNDLGAGKITINQMRKEYGLPPLPGRDELLIVCDHDEL